MAQGGTALIRARAIGVPSEAPLRVDQKIPELASGAPQVHIAVMEIAAAILRYVI
jgi:hypothetical protein